MMNYIKSIGNNLNKFGVVNLKIKIHFHAFVLNGTIKILNKKFYTFRHCLSKNNDFNKECSKR